jgi:hypothetical protein
MKALLAIALTLAALPCAAQATITPSQTRLIGCFGEAFTLVEHVWRIAPSHLDLLTTEAGRQPPQFLSGVVASGLQVDQQAAMAVARNLDGCLTEATRQTTADATTAVLATALRIELDSAIEDVAALISQAAQHRDALRRAIPSGASDRSLDSPLDAYLGFGEAMKNELLRLRGRADALVAAATPVRAQRRQ